MQLGATHSRILKLGYAKCLLKVVAPSNPKDALGLLRSSIKDPNPVIFAESAGLYGTKGDVPEEYFDIEIGKLILNKKVQI